MLGEDVASVLTGFKKLIVQVLGKGKTWKMKELHLSGSDCRRKDTQEQQL